MRASEARSGEAWERGYRTFIASIGQATSSSDDKDVVAIGSNDNPVWQLLLANWKCTTTVLSQHFTEQDEK